MCAVIDQPFRAFSGKDLGRVAALSPIRAFPSIGSGQWKRAASYPTEYPVAPFHLFHQRLTAQGISFTGLVFSRAFATYLASKVYRLGLGISK
jgi:hypothetical protein